jgi:ATP/ADP translocase
LAASTPYLGGILGVIIVMWINAAKSLAIKFKDVSKDCEL